MAPVAQALAEHQRPAGQQRPVEAVGLSVPLWIDSPAATAGEQPVTVGVPLPRGLLADAAGLGLLDAAGEPVPLQAAVTARWPDGSARWVLLDFVLGPVPEGRPVWTLHHAPAATPTETAVRIAEDDDAIRIDTGAAVFHLDRADLLPLRRVVLDGHDLLAAARLVFTDGTGRRQAPRVERLELEARGPVRVALRVEGALPGRAACRFVARASFFAGTGLVRLDLALHNPNRARHRGGLWDLGDPGSLLFRGCALEFVLPPGDTRADWTADVGGPARTEAAAKLELYQGSSGGPNWQSRNHVNRDGRVPCSIRGYRLRAAGADESGLRASPVVALRAGAAALTAAVPEFWQQFPKAVEADGGLLRLGLFPRQWGDLFELQGGEQKTHTVWLRFGPGDPADPAALAWVHQPARVHTPPAWYAGAGVIPAAGLDERLDSLLAAAVKGDTSLDARRVVVDQYGWRNFGEVYADHEAAYYQGLAPVVSHYNNQYDVVQGALVQFWRTGDPRWFELLDPLARHVRDIDIYHTIRDRAAYNGGLFWHTDHYRDAATATHRAYSRANARPGSPYGGGPSNEHNYTTGLLHYYYATGDLGARDAVLSLAHWVLAMDDGRRTVLGLLDDGPTGLASCTRDPAYHGPGRGAGNSVNALLDAWLLTGARHYLDYAETLIRRCVHPADDVAGRDLLNVEDRWSYTVFLAVLARYLDLKEEAGEQDGTYRYARAALVRYAGWMAEHEEPYFDHPEKLQYPTETWAAQELRKANVLRLAARHAAEPLHGQLLRRGEEFAEQAWRDLLRFESRTAARALALVMAEGTRDLALRSSPSLAAGAAEAEAFPPSERFVPQRQRVLARLKTPAGLVRALLRLVSVSNWRRFLEARGG
jgi:hypothetical protein